MAPAWARSLYGGNFEYFVVILFVYSDVNNCQH